MKRSGPKEKRKYVRKAESNYLKHQGYPLIACRRDGRISVTNYITLQGHKFPIEVIFAEKDFSKLVFEPFVIPLDKQRGLDFFQDFLKDFMLPIYSYKNPVHHISRPYALQQIRTTATIIYHVFSLSFKRHKKDLPNIITLALQYYFEKVGFRRRDRYSFKKKLFENPDMVELAKFYSERISGHLYEIYGLKKGTRSSFYKSYIAKGRQIIISDPMQALALATVAFAFHPELNEDDFMVKFLSELFECFFTSSLKSDNRLRTIFRELFSELANPLKHL